MKNTLNKKQPPSPQKKEGESDAIINTDPKVDVLKSLILSELQKAPAEFDTQAIEEYSQLFAQEYPSAITEEERQMRLRRVHRNLFSTPQARHKSRPIFKWSTAALAASLLLFFQVLFPPPPFQIEQSPDEEQYIVYGVDVPKEGVSRADNTAPENEQIDVPDIQTLEALLGHSVSLPKWMPPGLKEPEIVLLNSSSEKSVDVYYEHKNPPQRAVSLLISYPNERGATYYEQDRAGKNIQLANGASIYVATNVQSIWGLYTDTNIEYYISLIGYDENTLIQIFNSIGDFS